MKTSPNQQANTIESLQNIIADLQSTLAEKDVALGIKDETIKSLNHQIHLFRTAKFGRKSEKNIPDAQGRLFDEAIEEEQTEVAAEQETITYTRNKKGTGRKALPKNLPYVEAVHDIADEEKQCECGSELTYIGDDVTEKLDVLPQVTFRVVNVQKKYACKCCEETIKSAKRPKEPFPKCIATSGLVSAIIDAKFNRHLPLYRQEDIFKSMGVKISRASLSNWVIKAADLLKPLVDLMISKIRQYDVAYADETTLQVLKGKVKPSTSKNYMWLFIGGPPDKQNYVYQYHPTRAESVAVNFFEGFSGYLHADCYRAYVNLDPNIIRHVACFAHARRYFMDIVKANKKKKGLASDAVDKIAKLYKIEKELKEKEASTREVYQARQEQSKPLLDELKLWLLEHRSKVPPKSPIAKAINYSIKHWDRLVRYIDDGRLEIDNNKSERAIKPFVIGRKNWLFNNNERGANAASILYSLTQTCKAHDIDVFAYFKFAFDNIIHGLSEAKLEKLLPYNCSKDGLAAQRAIPQLIHPAK